MQLQQCPQLTFSSDASAIFHLHSKNITCLTTTILKRGNEDITPVIITGSSDKTVIITHQVTGEHIFTFTHHQSPVLCVEVSSSRPNCLITGGMDGTHHLIDLDKMRVVQTCRDHSKYVTQCKISYCGNWLVTASRDQLINVYRFKDRLEPHARYSQSKPIESMAFLPHSPVIVLGMREDHALSYMDLNSGEVKRVNMNVTGDDWVSFTPMYISVSPTGDHLLVYTDSEAGRIIIYETETSRIVKSLWGLAFDDFASPQCAWHPKGRYIVATNHNELIKVFDASNGECVTTLNGHMGLVRSFSVQDNMIFSCAYDKTVRTWSIFQ